MLICEHPLIHCRVGDYSNTLVWGALSPYHTRIYSSNSSCGAPVCLSIPYWRYHGCSEWSPIPQRCSRRVSPHLSAFSPRPSPYSASWGCNYLWQGSPRRHKCRSSNVSSFAVREQLDGATRIQAGEMARGKMGRR